MLISKRSLILGAGAAFITRPALALPSEACRGPFNSRQIGPTNPTCFVVPNGLIGYWPLSADTVDFRHNIAFDVSGFGNHGTMTGLPSTSLTQAPVGSALAFDGSTSVIRSNINTRFSNSITSNVTLASWVYPTSISNTYCGIICTSYTSSGFSSLISSQLYDFYDGTSQQYSGTTPITNKWSFVVWTYQNSGNIILYVNATKAASFASTGNLTTGSVLQIGNYSTSSYFFGNLGPNLVYNRALDPWEVTALYQAGLSGSRTPLQKAL